MKKIKNYKVKGSYAVEAAFIVPIILGLIFTMIYILYYFHDKNVAYANMQKAIIDVAEGRKEYTSDNEWQKDIQNNLWMFKVQSGSISKDKLYINSDILAECSLDIPIINYFLKSKQTFELKDKYLAIHPEYMIRTKKILSKK